VRAIAAVLAAPAMALAAPLVADAPAAPARAATGSGARLQGTWTMRGRVTRADGVRGERKGQRVVRSWSFRSLCSAGPCSRVSLSRERPLHQVDRLVLHRTAPRQYVGHGRFFVRLRCGTRTYPRGGVAFETVRLRVTQAQRVQGTPFATAVSAAYSNPRRVNHTPCAGSIGSDAGAYSGRLATSLPAPPTADFSSSPDPITQTVSFADRSAASNGDPVVSWRWDFGDPASGAANVSSAADPTHHYATHGAYMVTLTVRDANGLTGTIAHEVVV
jgi:hypothetical protein